MSSSQLHSSSSQDQDLRLYVGNGDGEAFRRLVVRHLPAVRGTAARVLGADSAWVDDVAQHVFLSLARKAAVLGPEVTLSAWLHRQTVRRAIDIQRSEISRHRRELAAAPGREENAPEAWGQMTGRLDREMLRLPERDREILILRFMESFSSEEVGRKLGMTAAGVRKRIERTTLKLRQRLRISPEPEGFTTAALFTCLGVPSSGAVPTKLAATICTQCAGVRTGSGILAKWITTFTMNKTQGIAITAILLAGTGAFIAGSHHLRTDQSGIPASIDGTPADAGRMPPTGSKQNLPATRNARIARLQSILSSPDEAGRTRALANFLSTLDPSEFGDMIDFEESFQHLDIDDSLKRMMYLAWAKQDIQAVFVKLAKDASEPQGGTRFEFDRSLAAALMRERATEDPDAAIQLALAHLTPEDPKGGTYKTSGIESLFDTMGGTDLAKATTALAKFEDSGVNEALEALIPHAKALGPARFDQWVDKLPGEAEGSSIRHRALLSIGQDIQREDPPGSMDFTLKHDGSTAIGSAAWLIMMGWVQSNPEAAADYIARMPSEQDRANLRSVFTAYGKAVPAGR